MKKKVRKSYLAVIITAVILAASVLLSCIARAAEETRGLSDTVTVTINYYYYDDKAVDYRGSAPYRPFVANMRKHSTEITEQCPVIPGYKPYSLSNGEYVYTPSVTLSFEEDDASYDIFYKPADVSYTIKLMMQNLTDNGYTVGKTLYGVGLTGDVPEEFGDDYRFPENYSDPTLRGKTLGEAFDGYTLMYYQPEVIAADGGTEFECYYDRNHYNVHFDLGQGGFGVAPIYAPYGFTLSTTIVGTPTRPGFVFQGWDPPLEPIVSGDKTYTAKWEEQVITVPIVYKTADIKQDGEVPFYSYWGNQVLKLKDGYLTNRDDYSEGTPTRAGDVVNFSKLVEDYSDAVAASQAAQLEDAYYYQFDLEKTIAENNLTQAPEDLNGDGKVDEKDLVFTIKGDGSTVITLYYARKTYTIRFAYARQRLGNDVYDFDTQVDTSKQYLLFMENSKNSNGLITAEPGEYVYQYVFSGLQTKSLSEGAPYVYWHFDQAKDSNGQDIQNGYYIWTEINGQRKYLNIEKERQIQIGSNNNKDIGRTELVDEAQKNVHYCETHPNSSDFVVIYRIINNKKWYLNDAKDQGTIAGASDYTGNNLKGHRVRLLNSPEKVSELLDVYVANRTHDGDDKNPGTQSGGVEWTKNVSGVPTLNIPEGGRLFATTYDKTFYKSDGTVNTRYRYYCVALTAEYGEDIERFWPADVLEPINDKTSDEVYKFGSWSSPKGSMYRKHAADHANIIGHYPTMSSDLMIDFSTGVEPQYDPDGNEYGPIFYAWWGDHSANIGYHGLEIYYELLEGQEPQEGDELIDGKYFRKRDLFMVHAAHNKGTRIDPFMYEGVTIIPSEANGYSESHDIPGHEERMMVLTEGSEPVKVIVTKFHYTRKINTLYFENRDAQDVNIVENVQYGRPLSEVRPENLDDVPYPSAVLPVDKYYFAGWYTSMQFFTDEFKVDWDNITMPDRALKLYAYWKPKEYRITFYNDEVDYERHNPLEESSYNVEYGSKLETQHLEAQSKLRPNTFTLPDGTTGEYRQVGWYYVENGVEHAFDPDTMTVEHDMDLYMKWTSEIPTSFTVYYQEKNTGKKIADTTSGYSFVGLTRTFNAKLDDDLYPVEGNGHYYPCYSSSSILMKPDASDNVLVMEYFLRGNAPYRVRYICVDSNGNETKIHEDKNVQVNNKSIVTECFRYVEGYVPTKYYSTLTITVSDEYDDENEPDPDKWNPANVITFYYKKDKVNMPFHVKYMLEDANGTETVDGIKYKQASYIDDMGECGMTEKKPILDFIGYEPVKYQEFAMINNHDSDEITVSERIADINEGDTHVSFVLSELYGGDDAQYSGCQVVGKELHIYYNKKLYPVKVNYTFTSSVIVGDVEQQGDESPEQAQARARQEAENASKEKIQAWYDKIKELYPEIVGAPSDAQIGETTAVISVYRIVEDQKYGDTFEDEAPDLSEYGFRYAGDDRHSSIVIVDDSLEPDKITRNKIDYHYTETQYIMMYFDVVLPVGDEYKVVTDQSLIKGFLSENQHHLAINTLPERPVTATTENSIYTFVGWFQDEECQYPVHDECLSGEKNNVLMPVHHYAKDVTFYAKYDYRRGDLTITAEAADSDKDDSGRMEVFAGEYFECIVRGKIKNDTQSYNDWIEIRVLVPAGKTVTVKSLPIGDYYVDQTEWNWRHTPDEARKTATVIEHTGTEETAAVVFKETLSNTKWLTGFAYYTKEA